MICYEKFILEVEVSAKLDISCDPLYELIRNGDKQLIASTFKPQLDSHAAIIC
ncbi:MAG: hypothetical protein ACTS73_05725 [Arsenophonus sp. NEOnobi-MAG3]